MPQAMKIPAAKAAVDKEWEKFEKISAWNLTKVKSKKKVIDEARMSSATVHFASLMDICHLKNAELEAKHQKYKGRVVFRGDIGNLIKSYCSTVGRRFPIGNACSYTVKKDYSYQCMWMT